MSKQTTFEILAPHQIFKRADGPGGPGVPGAERPNLCNLFELGNKVFTWYGFSNSGSGSTRLDTGNVVRSMRAELTRTPQIKARARAGMGEGLRGEGRSGGWGWVRTGGVDGPGLSGTRSLLGGVLGSSAMLGWLFFCDGNSVFLNFFFAGLMMGWLVEGLRWFSFGKWMILMIVW